MNKKFFKSARYNGGKPSEKEVIIRKKKRWSAIILPWAWLFLLLAFCGVFIYAPFFRINRITVTGLDNAELSAEILLRCRSRLDGYSGYFWPRNHYFFSGTEKISAALLSDPNLASVSVRKIFPSQLAIAVRQRKPVVLWQSGNDFFYVDSGGFVMSAIALSAVAYDLPLLTGPTSTPVVIGRSIIAPSDINFVIAALDFLKDILPEITVTGTTVSAYSNEKVVFSTSESWRLILPIAADYEERLLDLARLIAVFTADDRAREYIDLSVKDKIFYK